MIDDLAKSENLDSPISNKRPAPMRESIDDNLSFDQESKLPGDLVLEREVKDVVEARRTLYENFATRDSLCPICHQFMLQPILLVCGHHVCKSCLQQ